MLFEKGAEEEGEVVDEALLVLGGGEVGLGNRRRRRDHLAQPRHRVLKHLQLLAIKVGMPQGSCCVVVRRGWLVGVGGWGWG